MQYAFWQVGGDELPGGSQTRRYEERDEKKETKGRTAANDST